MCGSVDGMGGPAHQRFSFVDYVQLEAESPIKHEYLDGHVWAMAGGTPVTWPSRPT